MKKTVTLLLCAVSFLLSCCAVSHKNPQETTAAIETAESSLEMQPVERKTTATVETAESQDSLSTETSQEDVDPDQKMIALTFDDGPEPVNTPKLLKLLKKENVPATFFLVGQNVDKYPEVVRSIADYGQGIGNHTYNHQDLTTLNEEQTRDEIEATDQAVKKITGEKPKYFRPPYGALNSSAAAWINRPIIQWSVDSEDWQSKNQQLIIEKVISTAYDGSIILLHDIHEATIAAVPEIITTLKNEGYSFVSLDTLLDHPETNENYYGKNDHRPID